MEGKSHLIEFFGKECTHCRTMAPLTARLQDENDVEIMRLEVWHNEQNARLMREYDQGRCGGVPFFYNTQTGKWLCGSVNYEKVKNWALGN
jgi:thiol-disulfide isomerase/thioredoxin